MLAVGGLAWLAWQSRGGRSLRGRVVIITGGSRGLGFLLAERLLDAGCRVVICARNPIALRRAQVRLANRGEIDAVPCDVSDPRDVAELIDATIRRHGHIDILLNNAATIDVGPLEMFDLDDFHEAMNNGFWGTVHTVLAVLPHMRRRGHGTIANVTSIGGRVAVPHLLPYDSTKFATFGFSEGLRAELAGSGIHVTTVVPGLMRTGSPVHVVYHGQPEKEYLWFSLGDLLPLTAMSAARAADRIVLAIRRREGIVTLSWQARVLQTAYHVAPSLTQRALGLAARALPDPGERQRAAGSSMLDSLPAPARTALEHAAGRTNQW